MGVSNKSHLEVAGAVLVTKQVFEPIICQAPPSASGLFKDYADLFGAVDGKKRILLSCFFLSNTWRCDCICWALRDLGDDM
eukprot:scaffold57403_cov33-Attheya_sp.AAC.1